MDRSPTIWRIPQYLPEPARRALQRYRTALWRRILLVRLSQAILLAGSVVLAGAAFDRLVDVPGIWRWPLPALAVLFFILPLAKMLMEMRRALDVSSLANALDKASGDRREHLRSALDFSHPGLPATFFTNASLQATTARWQDRDPDPLVNRRPARHWGIACLLAAGIAAAIWHVPDVRAPLLWRRFWNPTGNYMRPTATWFTFDVPQDEPWLTGDDMPLNARLAGRKSAPTSPLIHIRRADGSTTVRNLTAVQPELYHILIRRLTEDFEWYVSMGPVRSAVHTVAVTPRPTVEKVTVTYHYPRYTGMASLTESLAGRTIAALQGTRIQVTLHSNVQLDRVDGEREDERVRFRIDRDNPRTAVLHRILGENHQLHLRLHSAEGIESKHEPPLNFRAIADNPPSVSIINDLAGQAYFLTDMIDIKYRAQDDLGLAAIFVRALDDSVRPEPVLIDVNVEDYGTRHVEGHLRIPIADLVRSETRTLRLNLQAQDTRGQDGLSPTVTIQIAAESFDRQLRKLLLAYTGTKGREPDSRGLQSPQTHELRGERLRTAANRTTMLAEILEPEQAPADAEAAIIKTIRDALAATRPPLYYGTYWFNDFMNAPLLPRFRSLGADANLWAWLQFPSENLSAAFEDALRAPNPKSALKNVAGKLQLAAERQAAIQSQVQADHALIIRELIGYLAATTRRRLETATDTEWQDPEFLSNRRSAVREIQQRLAELPPTDSSSSEITTLLTAAAAGDSGHAEFEAIAPTLENLAATLSQTVETEALSRLAESSIGQYIEIGNITNDEQAITTLASGLLLEGDAMDTDERLLLHRALLFLRLQINPEAREQENTAGNRVLVPDAPAGIAFDAFQTLLRARKDLEDFRLGISNAHLSPGSPDTEAAWLQIREARLALLATARTAPVAYQTDIQAIAEALAVFANWLPAPNYASMAFLENLRHQEQACLRLATAFAPDMHEALRQVGAMTTVRFTDMQNALNAYSRMIDREIAFYEDTHSLEFGNMQMLKVRLAGLATVSLKLLDFNRLAALHGAGEPGAGERMARTFVGLGRVLRYFDEHIEALFWTHRHGIHNKGLNEEMWRGKVNVYGKLQEMIKDVHELAGPAATDAPEITAAIDRLQIGFAVRTKLQILNSALTEAHRTDTTNVQGDSLAAALGNKDVSREYGLYLIRLLRGVQTGELNEADKAAVQLRQLPGLPAETEDLLKQLNANTNNTATTQPDQLRRVDELIEQVLDMMPPRPTQPPPAPHIQQTITFYFDWAAIRRARQRRQERLQQDQLTLDRSLLTRAVGTDTAAMGALVAWAFGEREINRRKAGMAQNRLELGMVATGADENAVNLPDHIYRELKRAREGPMPELFRDESFNYLNQILKKARP